MCGYGVKSDSTIYLVQSSSQPILVTSQQGWNQNAFEFLIGEVGYSDSGNFTRQRRIEWLRNALGKVCHINIIGRD
jgi:hypothetical protein